MIEKNPYEAPEHSVLAECIYSVGMIYRKNPESLAPTVALLLVSLCDHAGVNPYTVLAMAAEAHKQREAVRKQVAS